MVFPVMHGPLCEDGTIQGLLELADLPYVGCGVLASAVAMDKEMAKRVARDAGIPIVPYVSLKHEVWKKEKQQLAKRIEEQLGYPVFVKPANLGSSVGVHKVKEPSGLNAALEDAFNYDTESPGRSRRERARDRSVGLGKSGGRSRSARERSR